MGMEQEIVDVGVLGHDGTFVHFIGPAPNLGCWGCSIIPTQGICDCINMGPRKWPNNYRR
jgi:hypothetical protein